MTQLGLQDLSAVFDVRWSVLFWTFSFIRMKTRTDIFNGTQSTPSVLDCVVPQVSVLGTVLYLLHSADVSNVALGTVSVYTRAPMIHCIIAIPLLNRNVHR